MSYVIEIVVYLFKSSFITHFIKIQIVWNEKNYIEYKWQYEGFNVTEIGDIKLTYNFIYFISPLHFILVAS